MRDVEIDWSKAPEGATHYAPTDDDESTSWMMKVGDRAWCFWDDNGCFWESVDYSDVADDVPEYILRPTKSEWADGLPPVGGECEVNLYGYWFAATILAYGRRKFLYEILPNQIDHEGDPIGGELDGDISRAKFRPIRTEAEKQREN